MDECTTIKLHHLCIMCLTPTDNGGTRICHESEVFHLLRVGMRVVTFIPLKGGYHHISLRLQFGDLLRKIFKITRRGSGAEITRCRKAIDIRFVASDKRDLVAIYIE